MQFFNIDTLYCYLDRESREETTVNTILLLEDDLSLIDGLEFSLRKNGFQIE